MGRYSTKSEKTIQGWGMVINTPLFAGMLYLIFTPTDIFGFIQIIVGSYMFQVYIFVAPFYYSEIFNYGTNHPNDQIKQLLDLKIKIDNDLVELGYKEHKKY